MINKLILSHKRADIIITPKAISNCKVVIPESQLSEYKDYHPDLEYVTHPDSVKGLSPKRQWCFDKFGDQFQLDDDIMRMTRVYEGPKPLRPVQLTADEASDLIDDTYQNAKQFGAYFFGFNRNANPVGYHGNMPFKMTDFITGGAVGVMKGSKIFSPDVWDFVGEDYFLNAINAYYHRFGYVDYRFAFSFKDTEHGTGGVADYRTEQRRKKTYIYLKKHFGDAIYPKLPSPIKPNIMKWEKSLKINW